MPRAEIDAGADSVRAQSRILNSKDEITRLNTILEETENKLNNLVCRLVGPQPTEVESGKVSTIPDCPGQIGELELSVSALRFTVDNVKDTIDRLENSTVI